MQVQKAAAAQITVVVKNRLQVRKSPQLHNDDSVFTSPLSRSIMCELRTQPRLRGKKTPDVKCFQSEKNILLLVSFSIDLLSDISSLSTLCYNYYNND